MHVLRELYALVSVEMSELRNRTGTPAAARRRSPRARRAADLRSASRVWEGDPVLTHGMTRVSVPTRCFRGVAARCHPVPRRRHGIPCRRSTPCAWEGDPVLTHGMTRVSVPTRCFRGVAARCHSVPRRRHGIPRRRSTPCAWGGDPVLTHGMTRCYSAFIIPHFAIEASYGLPTSPFGCSHDFFTIGQ
jgi:hypothetical protein